MYKEAIQKRYRFPSIRGPLTLENLFELPLKSPNGFDLDNVARSVHAQLQAQGESFVEVDSTNPAKEMLEGMMNIIKDVIKTKQEERTAGLAKLHRAVERKKILDAMAAKKDQQLTEATMEDLEKKLAALDE